MILYEITFSPTGGTQRAADLLAQGWQCEKRMVDLTDPACLKNPLKLTERDVCIAALPVYGGRIPPEAARRLAGIYGNGAAAIPVAVYGNRAIDDALAEMEDILAAHGFAVVAGAEAVAEHSIARQFAAGRPDARDAAVLEEFGRRIRVKLSGGDCSRPRLPGNRPYKPLGNGMKPQTEEGCIRCGLCAAQCPVGAIPTEDPSRTDPEKCISCMRCIRICPAHVRRLEPEKLAAVTEKLSRVCALRREPKLYL